MSSLSCECKVCKKRTPHKIDGNKLVCEQCGATLETQPAQPEKVVPRITYEPTKPGWGL